MVSVSVIEFMHRNGIHNACKEMIEKNKAKYEYCCVIILKRFRGFCKNVFGYFMNSCIFQ